MNPLLKLFQTSMALFREMYIAETIISSTWKFSGTMGQMLEWREVVNDAFMAHLWYHRN
jgi:hypothetical protein